MYLFVFPKYASKHQKSLIYLYMALFDEKTLFDCKEIFFVYFRKNASKHQKSLV